LFITLRILIYLKDLLQTKNRPKTLIDFIEIAVYLFQEFNS